MKPKHVVPIAVILGVAILQAYVGYGLAYWLTPAIQVSLWAALAVTILGLIAALCGRPLLGLVGFAFSVTILLWQQISWNESLSESLQHDMQLNRAENAKLLSTALSRAPCGNGDVAILSMLNNPGTQRFSMSLEMIPANRAQKSSILVSTSGQYRPPDDAELKRYRFWHLTDCRNADYASLDDMLDRLRRHYWSERHKYVR